MTKKLTYDQLEQRVKELEMQVALGKTGDKDLRTGQKQLKSNKAEIADRKRAEEQLRESEERFRTLLDFIPGVSIQGYTTEGTVRYWNKASEAVYGYSEEEAIGKDLGALIIPPDIKPHYHQALKLGKKAVSSGQLAPPGEVMLLHKNGHLVPVYSIHAVVCLAGKPAMLFCIDVDLSERKRAEEVLRESQEKLRSIVEHANEVFFVHNLDHKITYVSPASKDILGYTPKEIMKKWTDLTTDNPINQKGLELTETAITTGQRQPPYNLEVRKKDGTVIMVEINESPIMDSQGNVLGITGALRDVTDQIRAEQALRNANENLEHRVKERTRELSIANEKMLQKIIDRKMVEKSLREKEKELKQKTGRLEEMNTALKVLLEHRDDEKTKLEENILMNVEKLVIPYLDKLAVYIPNDHAKTYLDIITTNLEELVAPFAGKMSSKHLNLTMTEMQVADFVRNGFTNKDISSQLNVSVEAISFHRKNIRKKLGLTNRKTNLKAYLQRLSG